MKPHRLARKAGEREFEFDDERCLAPGEQTRCCGPADLDLLAGKGDDGTRCPPHPRNRLFAMTDVIVMTATSMELAARQACVA